MRKIEVKWNGKWYEWEGAPPTTGVEWRYVGGVLEVKHHKTGEWLVVDRAQEHTPEERAADQGLPVESYRLRPYDDAAPVNVSDLLTEQQRADGWTATMSVRPHTTDQRTKEMRSANVELSNLTFSKAAWTEVTPNQIAADACAYAEKMKAERDELDRRLREVSQTAGRRGDELGTARTRITELEAECFRLRRRAEDAERAARRGKR